MELTITPFVVVVGGGVCVCDCMKGRCFLCVREREREREREGAHLTKHDRIVRCPILFVNSCF